MKDEFVPVQRHYGRNKTEVITLTRTPEGKLVIDTRDIAKFRSNRGKNIKPVAKTR